MINCEKENKEWKNNGKTKDDSSSHVIGVFNQRRLNDGENKSKFFIGRKKTQN